MFAILDRVRARYGHLFLRVGLMGFGVLVLAFTFGVAFFAEAFR